MLQKTTLHYPNLMSVCCHVGRTPIVGKMGLGKIVSWKTHWSLGHEVENYWCDLC